MLPGCELTLYTPQIRKSYHLSNEKISIKFQCVYSIFNEILYILR